MNIISKEILAAKLPEIELKLKESNQKFAIDWNDDFLGTAVRYYLLFTYWPSLLGAEDGEKKSTLIFYNRYYWFYYFLRLYTMKNGKNAGLEQQAFQLLEESEGLDVGIDWSLIEKIQNDIEAEIGKF